MTGILFFTFYGFRDFIHDIKISFESHNYIIYDLPYLSLKKEFNQTNQEIILKTTEIVKLNNIKNILFFLLPDDENFIYNLKLSLKDHRIKTNIIFYNFDDPISINTDLIKYAK